MPINTGGRACTTEGCARDLATGPAPNTKYAHPAIDA